MGRAYMNFSEEYDDRELSLIAGYMEKSSAISETELAKVIAANRAAPVKHQI